MLHKCTDSGSSRDRIKLQFQQILQIPRVGDVLLDSALVRGCKMAFTFA